MEKKIQREYSVNHFSVDDSIFNYIDSTKTYIELTIFIVIFLTAHQYTGFIPNITGDPEYQIWIFQEPLWGFKIAHRNLLKNNDASSLIILWGYYIFKYGGTNNDKIEVSTPSNIINYDLIFYQSTFSE